jgi:polyhydroxyalkanoate synthesis regulator phasin
MVVNGGVSEMGTETKDPSWRDLFEKMVELGLGAALLTTEATKKLVDDLVKRGAVTREDGKKLLADVLEKGKGQKEKMDQHIAGMVEKLLGKADLARRSALEALERRVAELEQKPTRDQGD